MQKSIDEVYYYLRGKPTGPAPKGMKKEVQNGPPLITVCLSKLSDGTVCQGVAICSPKDVPNKKEGRRIARNYMLKAKNMRANSGRIHREEARKTEDKTGYKFMHHSYFGVFLGGYGEKLLQRLQNKSENKAGRCPKCGERIENLRLFVSGVMAYIQKGTNIDGKVNEEEVEFMPDEEVEEYRCPECDEIIFDHQPIEAAEFLRKEE